MLAVIFSDGPIADPAVVSPNHPVTSIAYAFEKVVTIGFDDVADRAFHRESALLFRKAGGDYKDRRHPDTHRFVNLTATIHCLLSSILELRLVAPRLGIRVVMSELPAVLGLHPAGTTPPLAMNRT